MRKDRKVSFDNRHETITKTQSAHDGSSCAVWYVMRSSPVKVKERGNREQINGIAKETTHRRSKIRTGWIRKEGYMYRGKDQVPSIARENSRASVSVKFVKERHIHDH
jgi:hypothetical protein